jgi:hypothetical protein
MFSVVRAAAVTTQRYGKHLSAATNPDTTIEELCFIRGPCRDVISKGPSFSLVSSVRKSVKRGLEPGGRGIAIVGALTRKRLVTD